VVSALYAVGHTSGFPWAAPSGPENDALVQSMQGHRFHVMGATRTVWDFHVGFGLIISADLLVQAALLWLLASLSTRVGAAPLRPVVVTLALAALTNAVLVSRYFFVVPLCMALIISGCVVLALVTASHQSSPLRSAQERL